MDFSLNNAKAVRVWSDDNNLWLLLVDGRQLSIPIVCFPRLKNATSEQIMNYNLSVVAWVFIGTSLMKISMSLIF